MTPFDTTQPSRPVSEWGREEWQREHDAHASVARRLLNELGKNHPHYIRAAKTVLRIGKLLKRMR